MQQQQQEVLAVMQQNNQLISLLQELGIGMSPSQKQTIKP